eukprot:558466-Pelagomonas_calceolata.AAC.4
MNSAHTRHLPARGAFRYVAPLSACHLLSHRVRVPLRPGEEPPPSCAQRSIEPPPAHQGRSQPNGCRPHCPDILKAGPDVCWSCSWCSA